jgi:hypothetical protein
MKFAIIYFAVFFLICCKTNTIKLKNEKQGYLKASVELEVNGVKKFRLDDSTATRPGYTQLFKTSDGNLYFTFINNFNNSIYFYDYNTQEYAKKISWKKNGPKGVKLLKGYHIKSLDSIYLYNKNSIEILLTNDKGNILNKISLRGNRNDLKWVFKYPQYSPQTVMPFIETSHEILLNGFFFGSIPESIITEYRFTARLDFKTQQLKFSNTYPISLYGFNYNWKGDFLNQVYSDLHPDGDKLILSFPVSHYLYLADLNTGEYTKVYAGSNFAGTISSINKSPKKTSKEEILSHVINQDLYTAIKYDKYRKLYYRFLLKAASEDVIHREWKKKPIAIIVMDENFNYLGETIIGTGEEWYWQNSFITQEGLNIEYIEKDFDESCLTLKTLTLKKI